MTLSSADEKSLKQEEDEDEDENVGRLTSAELFDLEEKLPSVGFNEKEDDNGSNCRNDRAVENFILVLHRMITGHRLIHLFQFILDGI